jgi:Holliday junction DNA helicase RuvA
MIGTLWGKRLIKTPAEVIVETSGVGYRVFVPVSTLAELPGEGGEVFLYTVTHVREDAIHLYGFKQEEEKKVFMLLLGISGIGPRVALNIISGISHDDFLRAVEAEEIEMLTRIPGLGKKTAHRIVLELRGKLPREEVAGDRVFDDTLSALVNLGYRKGDALSSLEKAGKKGYNDIESLLREALRFLTGTSDEKD